MTDPFISAKNVDDFVLGKEQLDELDSVLGNDFSETEIILVHASILATPRFINMRIIPSTSNEINFLDPKFRMDIFQVATTLRIVGLSKYGMMMSDVLPLTWNDLSLIISTFQLIDDNKGLVPSYWVANFVDLKKCSGDCLFMQKDSIFAPDLFSEIWLCDLLTDLSFGSLNSDSEIVELIDSLNKTLGMLYRKLEEDEGSITLD